MIVVGNTPSIGYAMGMATARTERPLMVIAIGVLYAASGIGLARISNASTTHAAVLAWRLAAWAAGLVLLVAHVAYEQFRVASRPAATALCAALAAALGGLGLAIGASVHSHRPMMLALVIWPVLCGVGAFFAALVGAALLGGMKPNR
ncbi:MAG: hypothetical protein HYR74_05450 [Candidatus Eisenbacteria bacterium]|nr:hypothetical protein [Candidatus Eisenbacteria bacterium]